MKTRQSSIKASIKCIFSKAFITLSWLVQGQEEEKEEEEEEGG